MTSGLVTLAVLTSMAFVAALAIAVRSEPDGRAELALTTGIAWNALILVPIYTLGLHSALTRHSLTLAAPLVFALVIGGTFFGVPWRAHLRAVRRAAWDVLTLPSAGIALARRERSIALLALGLAFFVVAYSFPLAWFTPTWRAWDALWYHEPIVGFTIQNHGFSPVELPDGLQKINGYPRLSEMTQLWFAIFAGRRLVDVANSFVAPVLIVAEYLLCFRYSRDRFQSMAAGCAVFLMPAGVSLLQSTYVDLHVAGLELAVAYYATRPRMRLRDAAILSLALALAVGAKQMALVPVAIFGLVGLVRTIRQNRGGSLLELVSLLVLGESAVVAMIASIYVRNWIHFGNPFWPDLKYDNDALGIHWPGSYEWGTGNHDAGYNRIDMNLPWGQFLDDLFSVPYSWKRSHYGEVFDYGFPVAWIVLPLGCVTLLVLCFAALRALVGWPLKRWALAADTKNALFLAFAVAVMLYTTPALWASRYNIASSGLLVALLLWAGSRPGWKRFGEGLAGFLTVGAILAFFWATPRWWLTPSELYALSKIPYPEREVTPASKIGPTVAIWSGSPITKEMGLKREATLGEGAVFAFDEQYGHYPALFWNNDYSNKVIFVPEGPDFEARVKATNAMWMFCAYDDHYCRNLTSKGFGDIGPMNVEHSGDVLRREEW